MDFLNPDNDCIDGKLIGSLHFLFALDASKFSRLSNVDRQTCRACG